MSDEAITPPTDLPSEGQSIEDAAGELVGDSLDAAEASEAEETVEAAEEDSAEAEVVQEAIQDLKRKLSLKVDGEEIVEEIDLNDNERLIRALQKERAFDKRSQEWSSKEKQINNFVNSLKDDSFGVLSEMGVNVEELVENFINQKIEESEKSPEQLKLESIQNELAAAQKEREALVKEKEDAQREQLRNHYATEIENDIMSALSSSDTALPKDNPLVIRRIAENMYVALQSGMDVTAKDVIPYVEKQFRKDLKDMFDVMPEESIEAVVGKGNMDRYRKKRLKRKKDPAVKTATANQVKETGKSVDKEEKASDKVKMSDFFNLLD